MEENKYLIINEAAEPKKEESPAVEKTTVRFNTEVGEMKAEEEKEVV